MTRNELINDVVRVYFEGGNWQRYAKQLAREVVKNEHNTSSPDYNRCGRWDDTKKKKADDSK